MYESHFGLTGSPFQLNPDAAFYFNSRGHNRALSYLKFGANQGEGFIVVTGEIGAGKSTLVRTLLEGLDRSKVVAAQIVSTQLESVDLVRSILITFGVPVTLDSKAHLIAQLEGFLTSLAARGKRALLIIDEAQNLGRETIEELRMLSNFQLGNQSLLQSFLVGQPELRVLLKSDAMEQLRQRVIASCHLGPLELAESRSYIEHRLNRVGYNGRPEFTADAHIRIHEWTGGIPRRINRLCNRLLLSAYLSNVESISAELVSETAVDLRSEIGEASDKAPVAPASHPLTPVFSSPTPLTVSFPFSEPLVNAAITQTFVPRPSANAPTGMLMGLFSNRGDCFKLKELAAVMSQSQALTGLTLVHTGTPQDWVRAESDERVFPGACDEYHLGLQGDKNRARGGNAPVDFGALLETLAPSALIAVGHSAELLACVVHAKNRGLQLIRLGAGRRQPDIDPAAELNAQLLDRLADALLTDRIAQKEALGREGFMVERVQCVGNLTDDWMRRVRPHLLEREPGLEGPGLVPDRLQGGFGLLSLRLARSSSVGPQLADLDPTLRTLGAELPLVWPVSPWELAALRDGRHDAELAARSVTIVPDAGYVATLSLLAHASVLVHGAERDLLDDALAMGKRAVEIGAADDPSTSIENALQICRLARSDSHANDLSAPAGQGSAAVRIVELLKRASRPRPKIVVSAGAEATR